MNLIHSDLSLLLISQSILSGKFNLSYEAYFEDGVQFLGIFLIESSQFLLENGFCYDLKISIFLRYPYFTCFRHSDEHSRIASLIFSLLFCCSFLNFSKVNVVSSCKVAPDVKLIILKSSKPLTLFLTFKMTDLRFQFKKNSFYFKILEQLSIFYLRIVLFHILRVFHFLNCLKKFNALILSKVFLSSSQLFSAWKSLGLFSK